MTLIIADSSGLYALADASDPHHSEASAFLRSLVPGEKFGDAKLILSNHIFDEVMTLTKARLGVTAAVQLGLRSSERGRLYIDGRGGHFDGFGDCHLAHTSAYAALWAAGVDGHAGSIGGVCCTDR